VRIDTSARSARIFVTMAKKLRPGDIRLDRQGRTVLIIQSQGKGEPARPVLVDEKFPIVDKTRLRKS
jgi:hypothetical protein